MNTKVQSVAEQLEAMIDTHGLVHVLTGLALVCGDKAAHVQHAWQDARLARQWEAAARVLDTAARKVTV